MTEKFWQELSERYAKEDWAKVPSIFAQEMQSHFSAAAKMLELGCGQGQDGLWFAKEKGINVLATEVAISALKNATKRKNELGITTIEFEQLDLQQLFPYENDTFDIVYSHLALHYFDAKTTEQIFAEVYRVLKPGGVLAFLVNSVNDPEYNTGAKIEDDYFETEGTKKRYFSEKTAREFAKKFDVLLCDEKGETYKDAAKGVHNLVRFAGKKPVE